MEKLMRGLDSGDLPVSVDSIRNCGLSNYFGKIEELSHYSSIDIPEKGNSFVISEFREYGVSLYWDGKRLSAGPARAGSAREFPSDEREERHDGFIGYFHTHPRDDGPYPSDGDIHLVMTSKKVRILVCQSGGSAAVLVRQAKELSVPLTAKRDITTQWKTRYSDLVAEAISARKVFRHQMVVKDVSEQLCKKYGLNVYNGSWSKLDKVV